MSAVDEITAAIQQLPRDEFVRIQTWSDEDSEWQWDEQIKQDERDGRLDPLIYRAIEEHASGRTDPIDLDVDRLWVEEINRRAVAYRVAKMDTVTVEEVFRKFDFLEHLRTGRNQL